MQFGSHLLARSIGFVASFAVATGSACAQGGSNLDVVWRLLKTGLTAGEPVLVTFSVTNRLPESVFIDNRVNFHGYGGFRARIVLPNGQVVSAPQPRPSELVMGDKVSLAPAQSHVTTLLLNKWANFDVPGRYVVTVAPSEPITTASGVKLTDPADGSVVVEIGTRDRARLEKTCSDLAAAVISDPTGTGLAGAETLAYIKDPIAIPYLRWLLSSDETFAMQAVSGLQRIADRPAVELLLDYVDIPSEDVRLDVRRALRVIAASTSDIDIQRRIRLRLPSR